MNKRILITLGIVFALGLALIIGAIFGGAIVYTAFGDGGVRTALAALGNPLEKEVAHAKPTTGQEGGIAFTRRHPEQSAA